MCSCHCWTPTSTVSLRGPRYVQSLSETHTHNGYDEASAEPDVPVNNTCGADVDAIIFQVLLGLLTGSDKHFSSRSSSVNSQESNNILPLASSQIRSDIFTEGSQKLYANASSHQKNYLSLRANVFKLAQYGFYPQAFIYVDMIRIITTADTSQNITYMLYLSSKYCCCILSFALLTL